MRELRPLRVGEVLDAAIRLYARHTVTMWKIVAAVIVPLVIVQQLVILASLPAGSTVRGGTLTAPAGTSAAAWGTVAGIVLGLIGALIVNGGLALCLVDAYLDRPLDWRRSLRAAADQLGPLLWLSIVYGLCVAGGFILFFVPGVWLSVMWAVAVPAVMYERVNGFQALGRSFRLVQGRWWATFGALLVGLLLLFAALLGVGLLLGEIESVLGVNSVAVWLGVNGLESVISDLIAYPFVAAIIAVIYIDLRVRKEGLSADRLAGSFGRR